MTYPAKKLERVRAALEVPDCDCLPMYYGEWYDQNGDCRRVQLCRNRKIAREAFVQHLKEEVWKKGFRPRGDLICIYPRCEHVLAASHDLEWESWLRFLEDNFPDEYQAPAALPDPTMTWPGTNARVEIYARRHGKAELFSPDDLAEEDVLHLQRSVRRRRNGSLEILGLAIAGKVIPPC